MTRAGKAKRRAPRAAGAKESENNGIALVGVRSKIYLIMAASLPVQVSIGVLCASWWRGAWYVLDYTLFPADRTKSGVTSLALGGGMLGMGQYILSPRYNGTKLLVRMLGQVRPQDVSLREFFIKTNRFISLYGIAMSCVLIWRGTWLCTDVVSDFLADSFSKRIDAVKPSLTKKEVDLTINGGEGTRKLEPLPVPKASLHADTDKHHHLNHEGHDAVSHHDVDDVLLYSGIASHVVATVGLLFIGRFKSVMAPPANVSIMNDLFIHGKGKSFARDVRAFTRTS